MTDKTSDAGVATAEIEPQDRMLAAPQAGGGAPDATTLSRWVDALLFAGRQLGVNISPELVRNASAWAGRTSPEQAIVDIALSAGLLGQFVDMRVAEVSSIMLPALVPVDDQFVGVISAISDDAATIVFSLDGKTVERRVPLDKLDHLGRRRLLLVQERQAVRDGRLDAYLRERPKSWFTGVLTTNWRSLMELGVGSLFGNLLAIGTSLFAMQVWDRVVPARSLNTLWVLASGVGIALLLEFFIRTARVSIADKFGKQADLKLSAMFFARVLDIRNDARPRSPGTLISQLRDLEQMRELLTSSTMGVLIDLPFVIAFLFIIWLLGGWLVVVPLAAIPFLIIPGLLAQIPLAKLSNDGMSEASLRNAILMEAIYRAEDIKILQAEPRFRAIWNDVNNVAGQIGLKQRFIAGILMNFSQMAQQLAYVCVIIAGVYGILDGGLSFGAVLACSILTSRTIAPLAQITAILGRVQNARVGKKGLDSLLTLPVDHDPDKDAYHKPILHGSYRFENVGYAYSPEDKPALLIPKLTIKPGERIAVLGKVGAGKSTFLKLCGGLATPAQGRILFNDTSMGLIDVADVRRDIGFLMQESSLFYGSLRENLLIGNPLASDEEILTAMRLSCADQLLLNQPHGLDLKLRESGVGLSGGQKQSLMLARMYLRSPNILLLDEPTASLDEATERTIIERMGEWLGPRTLIVATHRLPVLALADRIIVVDGGRIVRDGPRDEMLRSLSGGAPTAPAPVPAPAPAAPQAAAPQVAASQAAAPVQVPGPVPVPVPVPETAPAAPAVAAESPNGPAAPSTVSPRPARSEGPAPPERPALAQPTSVTASSQATAPDRAAAPARVPVPNVRPPRVKAKTGTPWSSAVPPAAAPPPASPAAMGAGSDTAALARTSHQTVVHAAPAAPMGFAAPVAPTPAAFTVSASPAPSPAAAPGPMRLGSYGASLGAPMTVTAATPAAPRNAQAAGPIIRRIATPPGSAVDGSPVTAGPEEAAPAPSPFVGAKTISESDVLPRRRFIHQIADPGIK